MRSRKAACLIALSMVVVAPNASADVRFGSSGITLAPASRAFRLRIGGRLHVDSVNFNNGLTQFQDQFDVRRARLSLAGRFGKDWRLLVDRDYSDASRGWKNAWISYRGFGHFTLKAGQMVAPFGMEELAPSNDTLFMERALPSALTPGLVVGAQGSRAWKHGSATLGYFGNPLDVEFGKTAATGRSVIGRVTYSPVHSDTQSIHLGLAYDRRDVDPGSAFRISASPETGLTTTTLLNTRNIFFVEGFSRRGVEGAWSVGPMTLQAEYVSMDVGRTYFPNSRFDGWYIAAAYILTGERRPYKVSSGNFGEVRPTGRWGAVEVALRRSSLDLQDETVLGGQAWNDSVGVNWYLGRNFRVMANYTQSKAAPNRHGLDEKTAIFQVRAQVDY